LASTPARRAPREAVFAVLDAAFPAFCWRPRAWPPFSAAALREAALRVEEERVEEELRDEDLDLAVDFDPDFLPPPLSAMTAPSLDPLTCGTISRISPR
jgi:hypothetical protein